MTPKEKSENLIDKMYPQTLNKSEAIQCALIAIEEVFLAIGDDYFKNMNFIQRLKDNQKNYEKTTNIFNFISFLQDYKKTKSKQLQSDFNASTIDFKRFRDSSFIIKPFDASKPMLIGKDTIVNMIIENHYRDRVQVVKDTIHKVDVVEVEKKDKYTDNSKVYLYLFDLVLDSL